MPDEPVYRVGYKRPPKHTQFKKGDPSPNPGSRPRKVKNPLLAAAQLLHSEAENLTRITIEKAKQGNPTALRICMEHMFPRRDRLLMTKLPPPNSVDDAPKIIEAIFAMISSGELLGSDAMGLAKLIELYVTMKNDDDEKQRNRTPIIFMQYRGDEGL